MSGQAAGGRLDVGRAGDVLHVVLTGPVDMVVRERDAPALWPALADPRVRTVDLDAGAVTFLDSSGLSVLVRLARDAAERGVVLRLVATSPRVDDLLEQTGVGEWMARIAGAPGAAR
ncbi:anti-sigma-factor antagonist [Cellulomonas flavigena DSM 20109]|uniref:Anti-sigma factor antagonist n=1 Tax=Cellulomonas flavigena (strain ATCC 482 / DSM 20109 / BCRC 11376 / JCM 18109 / NBRC 3775 / NCIMB 8073 / NRS 134) TaxID=446466 RepID=D5UC91_CELFN|nr:STAS domain-containing protein [Cellulomonas flavigena]ADG74205.1 anti-sigma-factor antagonist [Cellulomonas flavigena DSM 20109]